jgi:2-polyprenyl-6-methoxyphenol hydroxylase-like FAD-dependent oxidoreductase
MNNVLVVGAGMSGLVSTLLLASFGVEVRVIDKLASLKKKTKATILHPQSLSLLACFPGLIREVVRNGLDIGTVEVGGQVLPIPRVLSIPQFMLEKIIIDYIYNKYKINVSYGLECIGIEQEEEKVRVRMRCEDGTIEETYDYVIGADGTYSTVRTLLGLGWNGTSHPETCWVADCELDETLNHIKVITTHKTICGIVPIPGKNQVRIYCMSEEYPIPLKKIHDQASFTMTTKTASKIRVGRVFLVGDSAHTQTPIESLGLNTGIQDAFNLCWKIALDERVDTYEAERKPLHDRLVAYSRRNLKLLPYVHYVPNICLKWLLQYILKY